jgi:hypothetical protein
MGLFGSKPQPPPALGFDAGLSSPAPAIPSGSGGGIGRTILTVLGAAALLILGVVVYNYFQRRRGMPELSLRADTSSGDKTPSPVDGKSKKVIPAGEVPTGAGVDNGIQFWMFISDWDYKFSQIKPVVKRMLSGATTASGLDVSLHPTDNSLQVKVAIYPNSPGAGAAGAPTTSSTGDSFTCTVENVPLQSWFSVSITVFQRNLDIYLNGRLVKSCVLPGIPKPAVGDVVIGDSGGFSGSVCNFHSYPNMLGPEDAKAFFAAGTNCNAPAPTKQAAVDPNSTFVTLFGYTFRFSKLDKSGKELSSYTF